MSFKSSLPIALTTCLLGGFALHKASYPTADDAQSYHNGVKELVATVPIEIDDWVGQEVPIRSGALALLKPNVILSRRYRHRETGQYVEFLLVQCRDARDMLGHFPPVCYPSSGWTVRAKKEEVWEAEGQRIPGMAYEFYQAFPTHSTTLIVNNLLLLPDGKMVRSMKAVGRMASDYQKHFYGAAQIQLVFHENVPAGERQQTMQTFLGAIRPIIESIGSGVPS